MWVCICIRMCIRMCYKPVINDTFVSTNFWSHQVCKKSFPLLPTNVKAKLSRTWNISPTKLWHLAEKVFTWYYTDAVLIHLFSSEWKRGFFPSKLCWNYLEDDYFDKQKTMAERKWQHFRRLKMTNWKLPRDQIQNHN